MDSGALSPRSLFLTNSVRPARPWESSPGKHSRPRECGP